MKILYCVTNADVAYMIGNERNVMVYFQPGEYQSISISISISINLYLNTVKSMRSIKIRNNLTILNKIQNLTTTNLTKTCFS